MTPRFEGNGNGMDAPAASECCRERRPSVAARLLSFAVRSYQVLFSQWFSGSCRFVPSCSAYAAEALARHGAMRGSWLAAARLARCHPFCRGGLDQVPAAPGRAAGNR